MEPVRCLLVSPATKFGSWAWLDKVIRASGDNVRWLVVSYGKPANPPPNARFVSLPETDYARLGRLLASRRLLGLNLLYYIPLAALAWIVGAQYRPHVVVGNGVLPAAILLPFRICRSRVLLAFHGYIGHAGRIWHAVLTMVLGRVDCAFVNSEGSLDDLARVIERSRIVVVRHWADTRFFELPLNRNSVGRFRVLFVGRLDGEKFGQCLRVCGKLAAEGLLELQTVGRGELEKQVTGPGTTSHGYVDDLDRLAAIYGQADAVWAPADTTYLSLPGVEGLAAGCPLIVSDIPAVDPRVDAGERVPRDLVPEPVGTVVDGTDDREAIALLRALAANGIDGKTRSFCRAYALRYHSPANLQLVLSALRTR